MKMYTCIGQTFHTMYTCIGHTSHTVYTCTHCIVSNRRTILSWLPQQIFPYCNYNEIKHNMQAKINLSIRLFQN